MRYDCIENIFFLKNDIEYIASDIEMKNVTMVYSLHGNWIKLNIFSFSHGNIFVVHTKMIHAIIKYLSAILLVVLFLK